jgi:hypothetical protein
MKMGKAGRHRRKPGYTAILDGNEISERICLMLFDNYQVEATEEISSCLLLSDKVYFPYHLFSKNSCKT